ncbi:uncharacterized protein DDB_G0286379-like [Hyposmocoma kahamanoa]|uniref:uncharacterized protein DDB_G0286379-like n=1 Tax=Hyposmocoma kahamanoa TaxID=1477025 RepID=UPI000E6DA05A|nr:uncharacterized protein DDB_G0286379-like [Hyposmocoma kahamanoa]
MDSISMEPTDLLDLQDMNQLRVKTQDLDSPDDDKISLKSAGGANGAAGSSRVYYPNSEEDCAACGCYYPYYPHDVCRTIEKCTKACEAVYDILCIDPQIQQAIRCWFSRTCQTNCYTTFAYTTKAKSLTAKAKKLAFNNNNNNNNNNGWGGNNNNNNNNNNGGGGNNNNNNNNNNGWGGNNNNNNNNNNGGGGGGGGGGGVVCFLFICG